MYMVTNSIFLTCRGCGGHETVAVGWVVVVVYHLSTNTTQSYIQPLKSKIQSCFLPLSLSFYPSQAVVLYADGGGIME